jgi:hypothetical protein
MAAGLLPKTELSERLKEQKSDQILPHLYRRPVANLPPVSFYKVTGEFPMQGGAKMFVLIFESAA